jgi:hypothetical protein
LEETDKTFVHLIDAAARGLTYSSDLPASFFDSGQHYGCSQESLSDGASVSSSSLYYLCERNTAVYTPAIVGHRYSSYAGVKCNEMAPDVTMAFGTYVDVVTGGSFFMKSGFWTYHAFAKNQFNIVWSYITQWLMWHTGQRFTVYWSGIHQLQHRNDDYVYKVVNLLENVECLNDFVDCTYFVVERMIDAQLVSKDFLRAVHQWFAVLLKSGYSFPHLTVSLKKSANMTCLDAVTYHPVYYSESSKHNHHHYIPISNLVQSMDLYEKKCSGFSVNADAVVDLSKPWMQFNHIVLVITFNEPHYEVIPYLEILYRSIFPHIVYCGPQMNFSRHASLKDYKITFITYSVAAVRNISGALSYECAIKIAHMNYRAKGYLFASDDLLLFPALLGQLRKDSIWFTPQSEIRTGDLKTLRECHLGMCDFYTQWTWWEEYRNATIDALDTLQSYCNNSNIFCKCIFELKRLNGERLRVNGGYSDIFYLPQQFMKDFSLLADVFFKSGVFLEVAVPTILRCLQYPEDMQSIPGKQVSQLSILLQDCIINIYGIPVGTVRQGDFQKICEGKRLFSEYIIILMLQQCF